LIDECIGFLDVCIKDVFGETRRHAVPLADFALAAVARFVLTNLKGSHSVAYSVSKAQIG